MGFTDMLRLFNENSRFIFICIGITIVCWVVVFYIEDKQNKKYNIKSDFVSFIIKIFLPCLVPILLFYVVQLSCCYNSEKVVTDDISKTYELMSISKVKGMKGNFSSSLSRKNGHIEDNMKVYFYAKEKGDNKITLMNSNSDECEFVYTNDKPYVQIIKRYEAKKYEYKNNILSKTLGINFPDEFLEKDVITEQIIYQFYIPEDSIDEYFNLDIPQ